MKKMKQSHAPKPRVVPAVTKAASPATVRMLQLLQQKHHAELVATLQDAARQDGIPLDEEEGRPPWTLQLDKAQWERAAHFLA
jgi:hypothetical protein